MDYVARVERLAVAVRERDRALAFGTHDVRTGLFNNVSNDLTEYAVSWTLIHSAQQLGRDDEDS